MNALLREKDTCILSPWPKGHSAKDIKDWKRSFYLGVHQMMRRVDDAALMWAKRIEHEDATFETMANIDPEFITADQKLKDAMMTVVKNGDTTRGRLVRQLKADEDKCIDQGTTLKGSQVVWRFLQVFRESKEKFVATSPISDLLRLQYLGDDKIGFLYETWTQHADCVELGTGELRNLLLLRIEGTVTCM